MLGIYHLKLRYGSDVDPQGPLKQGFGHAIHGVFAPNATPPVESGVAGASQAVKFFTAERLYVVTLDINA